MGKKKGAFATGGKAKKEQGRSPIDTSSCTVAVGPIVHPDGRRVHRGLMNLGNTCFVNSVAQCLNVSMPFSDRLLGLAEDGLDGMSGGLCTVMRGIRATDDTGASLQKFSAKEFQTELVNQFPWYSGKQQHDAHEFLRTLLGAISDERSVVERTAIEDMANGGDGPLPDLDAPSVCGSCVADSFKGHMLATSLCWGCGCVTARLDPFLDLSLEVPMPSGTQRKPLGITGGLELGLPDEEEEPLPGENESEEVAVPDGPLMGRWGANRDAEAVLALREFTPFLTGRIIVKALRRNMTAADLQAEPDGPSVQITLSRDSKKKTPRWGFRWSDSRIKDSVFVVVGIVEDSKVDKWNLKRMTTAGAELAIYPGDQLVEVNGEKDYEAMRQKLKQDNELELRFVRTGAKPSGAMHDETDDEAEEVRVALAAALEARRKDFCNQAEHTFETLPSPLKGIFGPARISRRALNGHLDLRDCLEQFSMCDVLEDEYQPVYSCGACRSKLGKRTFASRRLWLWPAGLPPLVSIQLKRFRRYAADFVKSVTSVVLPAEIDLREHVVTAEQLESLGAHAAVGADFSKLIEGMKAQPAGPLLYELYAVCEHQGDAMQDGHYVAYINSGLSLACEEWFGVSDAKLWKVERSEVLKVEAYMAFYRRVEVTTANTQAAASEEVSET